MNNPNNSNHEDLDDLLRQVDDLLSEPDPVEDDFDLDQYAPRDLGEDEPILYQNYSNRYGADVRNYSNNYGGQGAPGQNPQAPQPSIPAYNADFRREERRNERREANRPPEYRDYGRSESEEPKKTRPPKRRGGCCGCGCSTMLIALALVVVGLFAAVNLLFQAPESEYSIGDRKRDTATVLLCGTDKDGTRTDTMMLIYLSGSEGRVGLLSLPRDTYTITASGNAAKLNSAYGRNGTGQEGMEGLLDYVQDIIGYRPDGYILVDMTLVPQIVDIMGGVDMDVQQDIQLEGMTIHAGQQHLTGEQVLTLLRYRSGYYNADLGRIEVQRSVIQACMEQWLSPDRLGNVAEALSALESGSISSLNLNNYLWMGKTMLMGMGNIYNDTLPGYATYIGDGSYYVLYPGDVADMVSQFYNPYKVTIDSGDLNIAH